MTTPADSDQAPRMSAEESRALFVQVNSGDHEAISELIRCTHPKLHRMAQSIRRAYNSPIGLCTTELLGEAYLKTWGDDAPPLEGIDHLYRRTVTAMRWVIQQHFRYIHANGRDRQEQLSCFDDAAEFCREAEPDLTSFREVLAGLEALDPPLAHIVDLRFGQSMTEAEVARELGVSLRKVQRDWRTARDYLHTRLRGD